MTWQKKAQIGIAAFVLAFAAIVVGALRRGAEAPPAGPLVPRTDPAAVVEDRDGGTVEQLGPDGRPVWTLKFGGQLTYPDGRTKFVKGVEITQPDRAGRPVHAASDEAELIKPPGQTVGSAHLTGNVRITTGDGAVITASEATYSDADGMVAMPGRVEFTRGRLRGSGIGATYDRNRDVVWLLDSAEVVVPPDPASGEPGVAATAGAAGLARGEHYMRLVRGGRIESEGRVMTADEIYIRLSEDDERVQRVELLGQSRIVGGPGGQDMSARDIDLSYAEDGRTLQHARLTENAVVELQGDEGQRRIAGSTIDLTLAPDGETVTGLTATQPVQVDLPASGELPGRRIRAAALTASGGPDGGLRRATFSGNVDVHETRPPVRASPAVDRTARAQRLVVETAPGLGAIQRADFQGDVVFVDGATRAEAPVAIHHVARDRIDLSPGAGGSGPLPRVTDGQVSVEARAVRFAPGTQKVDAEGDVRSTLLPRGSSGGPGDGGRTPALLKQDQPVHVTSERLAYDGAASVATYTGAARLWQGETSVQGDTIVVDDRAGDLRADGNVRTLMLLDDVDPKTKTRTTARTIGRGESFVYEDAARVARYAKKAHLVGPQGDVRADRIDIYLRAGANELDRAEAYGAVTARESNRTAYGERLTYTAADERYLMTGKPVRVVEHTPPSCKETVGATLTFLRAVDSINVDGDGVYRTKSTPVPCGADRRF